MERTPDTLLMIPQKDVSQPVLLHPGPMLKIRLENACIDVPRELMGKIQQDNV